MFVSGGGGGGGGCRRVAYATSNVAFHSEPQKKEPNLNNQPYQTVGAGRLGSCRSQGFTSSRLLVPGMLVGFHQASTKSFIV